MGIRRGDAVVREEQEMKRAMLCFFALAAVACASNNPQKIQAYCARYSAKFMAYGTHENLNAYREDLMSSCMAMKGVPYASKAATHGSERAAD